MVETLQRQDKGNWHAHLKLEKYYEHEDVVAAGEAVPYETLERDGNILVTAGINLMLTLLTGGAGTAFSNANARIGVGDSATAAAIGQTDLQAATNKLRKAMDATYPTVATNVATFKATFGTSEANFAWAEWAVFNAATAGTMLNRKVEALGTKTTGTWVLTVTITIT